MENEIREIIRIEEEEENEERKEAGDEELVSREELESRLRSLRGKVPSFVINDLLENLTDKELTKKKLDRLIDRVITAYISGRGSSDPALSKYITELNKKIDSLTSEIKELKEKEAKVEEMQESIIEERQKEVKPLEELKTLPPEKFLFTTSTRGDSEVRLKKIPEDVLSIMIAMKWVEFLIEKVGITNLPEVLEFYCDLGWISEEVLTKLIKYAKGTKPFHEDMDWKPEEKLTARDHMLSLLFIERLRGRKISKDLLIMLDRELKKIRSSAEEIYGV